MTTLCEPWVTEADLCGVCAQYDYSLDPDDLDDSFQSASELLFLLTNQQFPGECTETVYPCAQRAWATYGNRALRALAYGYRGDPYPFTACSCHSADTCGCSTLNVVELPHGPTDILEVKVDGAVVPAANYRLDADRKLVPLGDQTFPCCSDLSDLSTAFSIEYTYGLAPPRAGIRAAAVLACEDYISCHPEDFASVKCRLPRNISAITRQGVSVIFESLTRRSGPFRFGIWEVDVFLEAYAPYGINPPSDIFSPDYGPLAKPAVP